MDLDGLGDAARAFVAGEIGFRRADLLYLDYLFDGIRFDGQTLLDIGGGAGALSFLAATLGASQCVCLEPALGAPDSFERQGYDRLWRACPARDRVRAAPLGIQEYDEEREFGIVLLHNSINHLDEAACVRLARDEEAKAAYTEILAKVSRLARPGATLIAADCSPRNLLGDLGLRNPFAPTIEWEKHQPPEVWARLLEGVGFGGARIRWASPTPRKLPFVGQHLLRNRVAAYLTHSHFCLTMTRQ